MRRGENRVAIGRRIRAGEQVKGLLAHLGVAEIKLAGQLLADGFGDFQQVVEVAFPTRRDDPISAEEIDELLKQGLVAGEFSGVEPLVGVLVGAFVVEAGLFDRGDDQPVAGEVDRVSIRLIDGRHPPPRERPVERVFRPLAFDDDDVTLALGSKRAEHRVGEFTVDLNVLLARKGMERRVVDGPRIAEDAAKDVGEEVG